MKNISIIIEGDVNSGKSCVASIINDALVNYGINSILDDPDHDSKQMYEKLLGIKNKEFSINPLVTITQKNSRIKK